MILTEWVFQKEDRKSSPFVSESMFQLEGWCFCSSSPGDTNTIVNFKYKNLKKDLFGLTVGGRFNVMTENNMENL